MKHIRTALLFLLSLLFAEMFASFSLEHFHLQKEIHNLAQNNLFSIAGYNLFSFITKSTYLETGTFFLVLFTTIGNLQFYTCQNPSRTALIAFNRFLLFICSSLFIGLASPFLFIGLTAIFIILLLIGLFSTLLIIFKDIIVCKVSPL